LGVLVPARGAGGEGSKVTVGEPAGLEPEREQCAQQCVAALLAQAQPRIRVPANRAWAGLHKVATLVDMTMVEQMALKDVKNHLSEVVDKVEREHERVVITKHGRPAAVVVSVDDLESLEQTLDILSRPALIKQIRESLDDLRGEGAEALSKDEALALIPRS